MTFSQPSDKLPDANPQLQRQVSVSESDSALRAGLMQKRESLARNLTTERHFISKVEVVPEPDVPEIGAVTPEAKIKKANDGVRSTLPRVRVYVVYRVAQDAGRVGERVYEQFQTRQIVGETNDHGTRKDDSGGSSSDTLMLETGEYVVTQVGVFSLGLAIHVFVHCPQAYLYLEF